MVEKDFAELVSSPSDFSQGLVFVELVGQCKILTKPEVRGVVSVTSRLSLQNDSMSVVDSLFRDSPNAEEGFSTILESEVVSDLLKRLLVKAKASRRIDITTTTACVKPFADVCKDNEILLAAHAPADIFDLLQLDDLEIHR